MTALRRHDFVLAGIARVGIIRVSIVLASLVLASCGFHLRNQVDLPPGVEPIYVSSANPTSSLAIELHNLLSASGVVLTDTVTEANYQLVILEQKQDRRVATLGERARAAEYQLIESVKFALRNRQGVTVLGPSTLIERRIMPNDPNSVVSTGEEENLLRREMLQNLAAKIARQLRSFDYSPAQAQTDS